MRDGYRDKIQSDLFSETSDVTVVRFLLADLHDDLLGKVRRFRFLADLGAELGPPGQGSLVRLIKTRDVSRSAACGEGSHRIRPIRSIFEHRSGAKREDRDQG